MSSLSLETKFSREWGIQSKTNAFSIDRVSLEIISSVAEEKFGGNKSQALRFIVKQWVDQCEVILKQMEKESPVE